MKILKSIFVLLFFISLASPVSALTDEVLDSDNILISVNNYEIAGVDYQIEKYERSSTEYIYVITYNGHIEEITQNIISNVFYQDNQIVASASRTRAIISTDFGYIYDESGNVAVYEGYSSFTIDASTTIAVAAMIISAAVGITYPVAFGFIAPTIQSIYNYSTSDLAGEFLGSLMSIYRFQYRSKYTMLNNYNYLYQYKRLWVSQFSVIVTGSKRYGPTKSNWSF